MTPDRCWRQWGLTTEGAVKAEALISRMVALAQEAKESGSIGLLPYVLKEAIYRVSWAVETIERKYYREEEP